MLDQKNLILAIVLSIAIIFGFQFLFPPAPVPPAPPQPAVQQGQQLPVMGTEASQIRVVDRAEALAATARVAFEGPRVHGSINLVGGRIDDLTLRQYRETVDPDSPEVVLLSPRSAPHGYYADFGWAAGPGVPVPGADTVWTADRDRLTPDTPVTLAWDNGHGLLFEQTFTLDANYMFTVVQRVRNTGETPVGVAPYARVQRIGTPPTLGYFILHEGPYGVFDDTLKEYSYKNIVDDGRVSYDTTGGWLGFTDKYWMAAVIPEQAVPVAAQFVHEGQAGIDRYLATFQNPTATVAPSATIESTSRLFAGAKEVELIGSYGDTLGIAGFDRAIDFGWFGFLTKPFFYILAWIHSLVGNFGVAIMIFTIALKLLFFPLADKSYRSMAKMKALQPEMTKLREQYGDDRQKINQELMGLYKKEKVNPAAGCLPIIIQIPVFFSLYKVLFVTIEMRHAPFFGWIRDLSAIDPTTVFNLFGLIPWTPPAFLMIGVWPLIMGATMYFQQKLNPAPADPIQARIFQFLPIVFTFMLAGFPVGLVIYWAWNNTLSIAQQWLIMKRMGVKIGGGLEKPEGDGSTPPSVTRKQDRPAQPAPAPPARSATPRRAPAKKG
jgi:YidC/Oxa1 family membrane protein insertase